MFILVQFRLPALTYFLLCQSSDNLVTEFFGAGQQVEPLRTGEKESLFVSRLIIEVQEKAQGQSESFVGVDPIPLLHGLTVGELAWMINSEGWLKSSPDSCKLHIVKMENWKHGDPYWLPVKPSPNLPNDQSIRLYPSLCFFEATNVSVGRGTYYPFQVIGYPDRSTKSLGFGRSSTINSTPFSAHASMT